MGHVGSPAIVKVCATIRSADTPGGMAAYASIGQAGQQSQCAVAFSRLCRLGKFAGGAVAFHAQRTHGLWHMRTRACIERFVPVPALDGKTELLFGDCTGFLELVCCDQSENLVK